MKVRYKELAPGSWVADGSDQTRTEEHVADAARALQERVGEPVSVSVRTVEKVPSPLTFDANR